MVTALNTSNTAYIFPGQGSQVVGMGSDLYEESAAARAIFDEADDVLDFHLSKLCFWGDEDELRQTMNAQPALLTTSVAAMAAVAEAQGMKTMPTPRFVAGHSLGEYTALVSAGSLSFPDALQLVRERGRLMQKAGQVRDGGMAAILGLDESTVEQLCQQTGAEIANNNSGGQIVISGAREAIIHAIDLSRIMGARKAIPLVVSGAFHSSLMQPAVPGMLEALGKASFLNAAVPVIGNCTAEPLSDTVAIHDELVQQLCRCVQWTRSVEFMAENGVENFVEIGPGKVLTGLVKRIARSPETFSIGTMDSVRIFTN